MQDNNIQDQVPPVPPDPTAGDSGASGAPGSSGADSKRILKPEGNEDVFQDVVKKIKEAENVLVALSNDPSVDEMAAAIGLTMALDSAGKHATAIYSGKTPNVLEFLNPEETFETNTDSLQDFIIALNKDKADHLRYKIDGDYVKVYITPYKTTLSEDDLEFSRGDFNIDLVVSLNVPAATELDGALREYGRIMHDATSINITNGAAGRFGDIEWVDEKSSSISEMVTTLALELNNKKLDSAIATALLTGLVAATDKFTNQATTPEVMMMSAKLMGFGADQQVVIQNVSQELEFNERADAKSGDGSSKKKDAHNELSISHGDDEKEDDVEVPPMPGEENSEKAEDAGAGNGLTGALADQMVAQENAPENSEDAVKAAMAAAMNPMGAPAGVGEPANATIAGVEVSSVSGDSAGYAGGALADQILNNMNNAQGANPGQGTPGQDYGQMIDQALSEPLPGEVIPGQVQGETANPGAVQVGAAPEMSSAMVTPDTGMSAGAVPGAMGGLTPELNPNPTLLANPAPSQDEIDAMNIINQAKQSQEEVPGLPTNGELPKIIPTGGTIGYDSPAGAGVTPGAEETPAQGLTMNPAMAQAPGVENMPAVNDIPTMNFGQGTETVPGMPTPEGSSAVVVPNSPAPVPNPSPLPMPGQELAPPPMTPTPDFGAMPPVQTEPTTVASTVPVQSPMQAPQSVQAPASDPGAFQIPGSQF